MDAMPKGVMKVCY